MKYLGKILLEIVIAGVVVAGLGVVIIHFYKDEIIRALSGALGG